MKNVMELGVGGSIQPGDSRQRKPGEIILPEDVRNKENSIQPATLEQVKPGELIVPSEKDNPLIEHDSEDIVFAKKEIDNKGRLEEQERFRDFARNLGYTTSTALVYEMRVSPRKVIARLPLYQRCDMKSVSLALKDDIVDFSFPEIILNAQEIDTLQATSFELLHIAEELQVSETFWSEYFAHLFFSLKILQVETSRDLVVPRDMPVFSDVFRQSCVQYIDRFLRDPYGKEMVEWFWDKWSEEEAQHIVRAYAKKEALGSCGAQLLLRKYPTIREDYVEKASQRQEKLESLLKESPQTIQEHKDEILRLSRNALDAYEALARSERKIGIEWEFKRGGKAQGNISDKDPLYNRVVLTHDILSRNMHRDLGVTEIKTFDGGVRHTPDTIASLQEIISDVSMSQALIAWGSVHINVDWSGQENGTCIHFRKVNKDEEGRNEAISGDTFRFPVVYHDGRPQVALFDKDAFLDQMTVLSDANLLPGGSFARWAEKKIRSMQLSVSGEQDSEERNIAFLKKEAYQRTLLTLLNNPEEAYVESMYENQMAKSIPAVMRLAQRGSDFLPKVSREEWKRTLDTTLIQDQRYIDTNFLLQFAQAKGNIYAQELLAERLPQDAIITHDFLLQFAQANGGAYAQRLLAERLPQDDITPDFLLQFAQANGGAYARRLLAERSRS
jgi:hypothetical protein